MRRIVRAALLVVAALLVPAPGAAAAASAAGGASTPVLAAAASAEEDLDALDAAEPDAVLLAQVSPPAPPAPPADPAAPGDGSVNVDINGISGTPSTSLTVILAITLLSVAPALLLMCTSFTKIVVVLSLTRNALGLQATPPNQVLVGLALFLSLFIMAPVLGEMNDLGVQPFLDGSKTQAQAFSDGVGPLREFMLDQTRRDELALLSQINGGELPESRADVALTTLIPAFLLSELKSAFIIGFIIFIPFLVIDIVVSSALMSMGMMMLPPVMISLPFKLLLFVLVDGWGLIVTSLVQSYG